MRLFLSVIWSISIQRWDKRRAMDLSNKVESRIIPHQGRDSTRQVLLVGPVSGYRVSPMDVGIATALTDRAMSPDHLARAVEERGFASLYLPEHTHLPLRQDLPPALVEGVHLDDYRRSFDPMVALAAAAAVTGRIRLGTGVLLVAQHDPVVLAKQLASLDVLSRGRLTLGVGYGWNRAEAEDHRVDFSRRRAIAHEKLACMNALWRDHPAEFHGEHVDLPPCWSYPKPVQESGIPILIGAAAGEQLFSAIAEHADGWMPIGGTGIRGALPVLREAMEKVGRDPATLRVVPFGIIPDKGKMDYYESLGVREVTVRLPSGSAAEMLGALDRFTAFLD